MPKHDRRKRSRSRSKDDHRYKRKRDDKFTDMQNQLDNLKKAIETLVQVQKEQRPANQSTEIETDNTEIIATTDVEKKDSNTEVIGGSIQEKQSSEDISEEPTLRDNVLKVLGVDLNESKFKNVKYHPELKNTWSKWMKEGLPEKNKKEIIELYNRKGDLYTEAPKINLEIVPLLSEIAKKRDEHFVETQNCVGTALAALGAAVSMLIDPPEEGLDEDVFTDYLSHAGQILTDVFHEQSLTRKSFITPQLNKNIKPTVDAMISDEWLYGNNLKEKVKDAKEIEKACAEIKDKAQQKNSSKSNRGNSKYPPANYRQVGYQQKHRQFRFKKRFSQNSTQSSSKKNSQTTSQSSSKK
ncbi:uncharacterized protein LOC143894447 [Temnothorax americanus]|uniref:uncharacterized protein LOC143894447 n=1 Tax=Temnothorax americanus TaxID=1964332 RepID=UPI00406914EF